MDLGIKGRKAIVCASSQGLGLACAMSLAREGCTVFINGRDESRLDRAVREIEAVTGPRATQVVADINTDAGRAKLVVACPEADILINNNAGPTPGELKDWDHAAWLVALEANMLAPILLIRALLPGMRQRRFGRIVNITSAMVKSPRAHMGLSTAARARIVETIAAKRFGRPEEFGDACAYLCSAQAGFISGQNLQLDGGSYRGLV